MLEIQACQRARLPGMGQESVVPRSLRDLDNSDLIPLMRNRISELNQRLLFSQCGGGCEQLA